MLIYTIKMLSHTALWKLSHKVTYVLVKCGHAHTAEMLLHILWNRKVQEWIWALQSKKKAFLSSEGNTVRMNVCALAEFEGLSIPDRYIQSDRWRTCATLNRDEKEARRLLPSSAPEKNVIEKSLIKTFLNKFTTYNWYIIDYHSLYSK